MYFFLLYGAFSVLLVGQISGTKFLYNASRSRNASKLQGVGTDEPQHCGPYVTNQYIGHATFTDEGTKKLEEKLGRVDKRLARLVALVIIQSKPGTRSTQFNDAIRKLDDKLERVEDGLTRVIGLLQKKADTPPSYNNNVVKKLDEKLERIEDRLERLASFSLQNKAGIPWIPNKAPLSHKAESSCKEIYEKNRTQGNKAYLLQTGCGVLPVYCHVTKSGIGACGGGGWTLVMKIDGEKPTFHYDSQFWSNKEHYNLEAGRTGFDRQETKLPTYWSTPFSQICLGMKIGHQIRFIVMNKQANSLHSLIAHGKYQNITLGSDTWKALIGPEASVHTTCVREGVNVHPGSSSESKARIGIVGSKRQPCLYWPYSRIGFGTGGVPDDTNSCGNEDRYDEKHIKAMGYILVQ